jgi:hypothetical protein
MPAIRHFARRSLAPNMSQVIHFLLQPVFEYLPRVLLDRDAIENFQFRDAHAAAFKRRE